MLTSLWTRCPGTAGHVLLVLRSQPVHVVAIRSHSDDLQKGKLTEDPFDFDTGITRSNGGLNAPIPDMLKYLNFLLGDSVRQAEYDAILKRSWLEEMWKPIVPIIPNADFASRAGAHDAMAGSFDGIPMARCALLEKRDGKMAFAAISISILPRRAGTSWFTTPTQKMPRRTP